MNVVQQIFDNIVDQAINYGLVGDKILYSDSTHLKANANKRKYEFKEVNQSVKEYIEELNKDVEKERINHNKNPLKKTNFSKI